jgi:hypothetical protein
LAGVKKTRRWRRNGGALFRELFLDSGRRQKQCSGMNKCGYCGHENTAEAVHCSDCGTLLVEEQTTSESECPKKSKTVAVILALIFGPIGLLYLGLEGLMVVIFVVGIAFFALPLLVSATNQFHGVGLLISLLGRAASAWWALTVVERRNSDPDAPDAGVLLDEAAKLENVDFAQAIAKYEELIAKYPDSSASAMAKSCLQTIRPHKSSSKI